MGRNGKSIGLEVVSHSVRFDYKGRRSERFLFFVFSIVGTFPDLSTAVLLRVYVWAWRGESMDERMEWMEWNKYNAASYFQAWGMGMGMKYIYGLTDVAFSPR